MTRFCRVEKVTNFISKIVLCRPDKRNALSLDLARDLIKSCDEIRMNSSLRAVVVSGEGLGFCSGRDLTHSLSHSKDEADEYLRAAIASVKAVQDLEIPTIAALHGCAIGYGLELALACDIRVASSETKLSFPETALGIFPGAGGLLMLPSLIGNYSVAYDWILTGRTIPPDEALIFGLVTRISTDPLAEAESIAEVICRNGPLGVREAKRLLRKSISSDTSMQSEVFEARSKLSETLDHKEALLAYKEKRIPVFTGR